MKKEIKFNPLIFLMALGAGGISIIPFAFLQYTFEHGKGLIKYSHIWSSSLTLGQEILFRSLESVMIIFSIIHLVLTFTLGKKLFTWIKSGKYKELMENPLANAGMLAPFISIVMTMNVFIGPIRYFIPSFAENLQIFMLPALIFWAIIWVLLLKFDIKLLKISFEKNFDVNKISFGWLLHPFALGMLTVTGTGIAAMAKSASIAHTAAFMSLISGTMGMFLLFVKLVAIFKSHFTQTGLPEKQFIPSFLIVIPNITLYSIAAFRIGHYLEAQFGFHLGSYFLLVTTLSLAFETWYLLFGLALMSDYFTKDFFKKEFYVTQWGLVCPVVAYAVLSSFVYSTFVQSKFFYILPLAVTFVAVVLFFMLFYKQAKCSGIIKNNGQKCI